MNTRVENNDNYNVSTTSATIEPNPEKIMYEQVLSFIKKSGKGRSAIEGNIYHVHLAIIIMLRAFKMRQQDVKFNFLIAIEVYEAGKFDDILYHYSSPGLGIGNLLLQAKHKKNARSKIERDSLFPVQENSTGEYSISMYFVSFLEVDQKLPNNARYILCTNASLHDSINSYFRIISSQQDKSLQFCEDIGATCYQFARDTMLDCDTSTACKDTLRNACLAKLGKELAKNVVQETKITFTDPLFNTFVNIISKCIEPLEQGTSDPSVSTYKLTEGFSNEGNNPSTTDPIKKVLMAFREERKWLLTRQKKGNKNRTTNELTIKIDSESFTNAKKTAEDKDKNEDFAKLDQKVREFCDKFLLVCNTCNEEKLIAQAKTVLPKWCAIDTVIDRMKGKLLDAMKSSEPIQLNLEYIQTFFREIELPQNISELKHSSKEYLEQLSSKFSHIKMRSEFYDDSKLYAFLQDKSDCGVHRFKSTLDLSVSSCILVQTLSLFQHETLFLDSAKYPKQQDMNNILDVLLLYLRDVNHPTIKVITILGKLDNEFISEIEKLSKQFSRKIVVVEKISESSEKDETIQRILVKDLSKEALSQLYEQSNQKIFGTNMPPSSVVEETDDLSFLLDVLKLYDQSREMEANNLNKLNYDKIKAWYVHRHFLPYEQEIEQESLSDFYDCQIEHILTSPIEEPDTPSYQDGYGTKVYIFLNDAGFGKTSYFTWLAWRLSTLDPSLYVVRFNAVELSTDLERLLDSAIQSLNDTEILRLLYRYIHLALFVPSINNRTIEETDEDRRKADRCANLLTLSNGRIELDQTNKLELSTKELVELRLFHQKNSQIKLVLVLDGFDETAPYYKDVVLKYFARFVRLDGVKTLYLSSRPYGFEEDLKKTFDSCRMFRLKPFSSQQIILSTHKFLEINLDDYKHYEKEFQSEILNRLYNRFMYDLGDIISIPLLLYMVQVIFLPVIEKGVHENKSATSYDMLKDANLDILHLVEHFIERKIKILDINKRGTTNSTGTTAAAKKIEDQLKKETKERHMLLAICVIFDSEDRQKLLSKKEQKGADMIIQEVNQGDEKTGIVLGVQNGMPQFLHRIFAEYFTACWLFENLERFKTERIFHSQKFWSYSMKMIREFLDRLILREGEGCDLYMALVNKSKQQIEETLHNNPSAVNVKDMVGRLPLHLVEYNKYYVAVILGKMSPDLINESDQLYGWNALDYAFVRNNWDLLRTLFEHGVMPNMNNLCQQVCSNDIDVLLVQEERYTYYLVEEMKQKHLAEELCESVANCVLEDQKLNNYTPFAQLNSLSVLERLITKDRVPLFIQLIRKSNSQALGLDDRLNGFLQLLLEKKAYRIISYLFDLHPSLVSTINDDRYVFLCAIYAIAHNKIELFKTTFRQFCLIQKIECDDEDNKIVEFFDQKDNEAIEILFEDYCCVSHSFVTHFRTPLHSLEVLFFAAINNGNIQITSYILQKTKIAVTVELIEKTMEILPRNFNGPKNLKQFIPVFKYLFKKIFDRYGVDTEGLNLFHKIIKHGCVYLLHSLFAIGFDPKQINMIEHWDVFEQCLLRLDEWRAANIFVYLQQRSYLDCFNTLAPKHESVFDVAITKGRFTVAQALVQDKFHNLSNLEKEYAVLDLIQKNLLKHDETVVLNFFQNLLKESSIRGKMANEVWHSIYVYVLPQILQYVEYNRLNFVF